MLLFFIIMTENSYSEYDNINLSYLNDGVSVIFGVNQSFILLLR